MDVARELGLKNFEPALLTSPCSICGKPMIFTHRDVDWDVERKVLREAFRNWFHTDCRK